MEPWLTLQDVRQAIARELQLPTYESVNLQNEDEMAFTNYSKTLQELRFATESYIKAIIIIQPLMA